MIEKRHPRISDIHHCLETASDTCPSRASENTCCNEIFCPWLNDFRGIVESYEVEGEPDFLRVIIFGDPDHCYIFSKERVIYRLQHSLEHCTRNR